MLDTCTKTATATVWRPQNLIDLHSHVVGGVDDGADDLGQSLEMARYAVAHGTSTLAATPHIDHDWPLSPLQVAAWVEALQAEVDAHQIPLRLLPAGEIHVDRIAGLSQDELEAARLGDSKWLLIEYPIERAVSDPLAPIELVLDAGYSVLLAHPERCPNMVIDSRLLLELRERGCRAICNSGSLTGSYGRDTQEWARSAMQSGLIDAIGSDAHDTSTRPPDLLRDVGAFNLGQGGTDTLLRWLTRDVPGAIVSGEQPPPSPIESDTIRWQK